MQKLVDYTLDLAMAIAWGLSRRTSPHHAERYTFYMLRYFAGIKELFPDYNLKPNHHYALHIPDILLTFGPLHGTWAFSIERLIGCLQKLNTNSKIGKNFCILLSSVAYGISPGEMEGTAMSLFCRRQRFIHFTMSDYCPPILKKAWKAIERNIDFHDLDTSIDGRRFPEFKAGRSHNMIKLDKDIQQALSVLLGGDNS